MLQAPLARTAHAASASLLLVGSLAGCSSGTSVDPVDWWRSLQDGPIADVRPPPPQADAPYPNLGSVPARPTFPDAATRGKLMSGLVADRANAQYTASSNPITAVPPVVAPPKRPTAAEAADSDDTSGAVLPAASAPPRAAPLPGPMPASAPPKRAPVEKVGQTALGSPAAPAQPLPSIPASPPPAPSFAGVPATAPAPPVPAPPQPVVVAQVRQGGPVSVAFIPGSATLPPGAAGALTQLAKTRGTNAITVTGFGDAPATDAPTQSAALPLALARARTIAANLLAAGVPSSAITMDAQALGRGGVAQVVN